MHKNGQNALKFVQNMYYDHFCQNLSKIIIFWLKNHNFLDFTAQFLLFNFQRKMAKTQNIKKLGQLLW